MTEICHVRDDNLRDGGENYVKKDCEGDAILL